MEKGNNSKIIISLFSEDGKDLLFATTVKVCDSDFRHTISDILHEYKTNADYNSTGLVLKGETPKKKGGTWQPHYNLTKRSNGIVYDRQTNEIAEHLY